MLHNDIINATIVKVNTIPSLVSFAVNRASFPDNVYIIFNKNNHHDKTQLLLSGISYRYDDRQACIKCLIPSEHSTFFSDNHSEFEVKIY